MRRAEPQQPLNQLEHRRHAPVLLGPVGGCRVGEEVDEVGDLGHRVEVVVAHGADVAVRVDVGQRGGEGAGGLGVADQHRAATRGLRRGGPGILPDRPEDPRALGLRGGGGSREELGGDRGRRAGHRAQ